LKLVLISFLKRSRIVADQSQCSSGAYTCCNRSTPYWALPARCPGAVGSAPSAASDCCQWWPRTCARSAPRFHGLGSACAPVSCSLGCLGYATALRRVARPIRWPGPSPGTARIRRSNARCRSVPMAGRRARAPSVFVMPVCSKSQRLAARRNLSLIVSLAPSCDRVTARVLREADRLDSITCWLPGLRPRIWSDGSPKLCADLLQVSWVTSRRHQKRQSPPEGGLGL
jgi:hypothetical protein